MKLSELTFEAMCGYPNFFYIDFFISHFLVTCVVKLMIYIHQWMDIFYFAFYTLHMHGLIPDTSQLK